MALAGAHGRVDHQDPFAARIQRAQRLALEGSQSVITGPQTPGLQMEGEGMKGMNIAHVESRLILCFPMPRGLESYPSGFSCHPYSDFLFCGIVKIKKRMIIQRSL